jgi:hypothetical protein
MKQNLLRLLLTLAGMVLIWRKCTRSDVNRDHHVGAESASPPPKIDDTHRFSREDVVNRLKSHSPNHYAGLYNVMKGVTLAAVGFSLIALFSGSVPAERTFLLLIALLSVLIAYNGEAIGQTIIHLYPATIDVFLPMALTVALLLVVLLPGADRDLGPMPTAWFIAFAAWNLIAAALVKSIAVRLDAELYAPYLRSTVERYRARMHFDAKCAAAVGIITGAFVSVRYTRLPEPGILEYVFLAVASLGILGGLRHHEATRKELKWALLATARLPTPSARSSMAE